MVHVIRFHAFFIKEFIKGITKKTRVIFLSHITSPTGLIFPVEEICQIAREKKIISITSMEVPGKANSFISFANSSF